VAPADAVFSAKPEYTREWLRTVQRECVGCTPLHALTNKSGARAVEELLIGIEHDWGAVVGNFLPESRARDLGRNETESTNKDRAQRAR
jgi:hypothetical protein